jgi:hypothetical protein
MNDRANIPEIRNPIKGLGAFEALRSLPPESRAALRAVLFDLRDQAKAKADYYWNQKAKPWSAVYFRVIAVYAQHIARALR